MKTIIKQSRADLLYTVLNSSVIINDYIVCFSVLVDCTFDLHSISFIKN